jgi:3',5'-cyclic AMP phosphodiesterase CpdA
VFPLTLGWVLLALGCGSAAPPGAFRGALPELHTGARIAVAGDLQRTAPFLEFWREQNDAERARVVAAIAAERPDLLLFTGDCVFNGGSDAQWEAFDVLTQPLRDAHIPVATAYGNHEYWLGTNADAHVFPRFPLNGRSHWFSLAVGPLRVVVLDSNAEELGEAAFSSELAWYDAALARFDADPSVRGVLVTFHHPPYTNSTVTGDEPVVQARLVPPFARARKTLAMLNGHVHSYERYVRATKTYVVSGGGGGPRARLATDDARRHTDDQYPGPALRDFNYTVYTLTEGGLHAQVRGLARGASEWRVLDTFELPWPASPASLAPPAPSLPALLPQ